MTEPGTEVVPTCYKHPDRETYVRCVRCDRPICPDCMRDASVGFQCPECVREGSKSIRQARTIAGGRAVTDAIVTQVLIGLCILGFVLQNVSSDFTIKYEMIGLLVATGEYFRMFTVTFLHANVMHIAFNMFALYTFGQVVEPALGRARFIVMYFLAGFGASVASYVGSPPLTAAVGASGAVFGLFGSYFVIAKRLRLDTSQITMLIGINLVIGFVIPQIDWRAHIGGLVVGAAITYAWVHMPRSSSRTVLQVLAAVGLAVVLGAIAANRTNQIRQDCGIEGNRVTRVTCLQPPGAISR